VFRSWSHRCFVRSAVYLAVWCSVAFAALVVACLFTSAAWLAGQGQPGAAGRAVPATEVEQPGKEEEEEEDGRDAKRDVWRETQPEVEEQEG